MRTSGVMGIEAVTPMEYIVPSFCIVVLTGMTDRGALEELEEE